jgi:Domain of unknown function (DUF4149)
MNTAALLVLALLFGGTTLFAFAFAGFLFKALPADTARATIRKAFPYFYLFVGITAALAAIFSYNRDTFTLVALVAIAITSIAARQLLMPAINAATDSNNKKRFALLHGASVVLTLAHIALLAVVLARFI